MTDWPPSEDVSDHFDRLMQIANRAVREAQEESRRLGVANVYVFNGRLLYEHPSGELLLTPPEKQQKSGTNGNDENAQKD